jgi:hypothetical protein
MQKTDELIEVMAKALARQSIDLEWELYTDLARAALQAIKAEGYTLEKPLAVIRLVQDGRQETTP